MQSKVFSSNKTLNLRGTLTDLEIPLVMGIVNVTPDSFFDGGKYITEKALLSHVEKMLLDGAGLVDIGGYSTRPGADTVTADEERQRVLPSITQILRHFPDALISVDTFRAETARQAVLEGACMINDITGGGDPGMFETAARLRVPYCLMHSRGTPATMSSLTHYHNIVIEIVEYLRLKITELNARGLHDIIIDPGFGFAKTADQNFHLLEHLSYFAILGRPILAGLSRKSMVWKTLDTGPEGALNGTTSVNTMALLNGADILRVHDVREAAESIRLVHRYRQQQKLKFIQPH